MLNFSRLYDEEIAMTDDELASFCLVLLSWTAIVLGMVGFYHVLKVLTGGK